MIKCDFCPDEFEFEDQYLAHLKIQHADEYEQKRMEESVRKSLGPFTQDMATINAQTTAVALTKATLEHGKTPEEVFDFYDQVLGWVQGSRGKMAVRTITASQIKSFVVRKDELAPFLASKGITPEEVETFEKVLDTVAEHIEQQ